MSNITAAKQLLQSEDTTATGCFCAVDALLSFSWRAWEPESIWLELEHLEVAVPESNRAQIMATRMLLNTDRFWYDANIFASVCATLNDEEISYEGIEDVSVAQLAWGVYEAENLIRGYDPDTILPFDREPVKYTAIQLYREGFIIAPDELSFAQVELDQLYPLENKEICRKVKEAWAAASQYDVQDATYPETPAGVQFAKLASVKAYIQQQDKKLKAELVRLS